MPEFPILSVNVLMSCLVHRNQMAWVLGLAHTPVMKLGLQEKKRHLLLVMRQFGLSLHLLIFIGKTEQHVSRREFAYMFILLLASVRLPFLLLSSSPNL